MATPDYHEYFRKQTDALVDDIALRAEFEFEDVWTKMQSDPLVNAIIEPQFFRIAKRIMKHGYIAGAKSGVLLMLEKVANELAE